MSMRIALFAACVLKPVALEVNALDSVKMLAGSQSSPPPTEAINAKSTNATQARQLPLIRPASSAREYNGTLEHVVPGSASTGCSEQRDRAIVVHPSIIGQPRVVEAVRPECLLDSLKVPRARHVQTTGLVGFIEHIEPGGGAFIACPGQFDRAVYVHHSMMGQLRVGDEVQFEWFRNSRGKPQAGQVQLVEPSLSARKHNGTVEHVRPGQRAFIACPGQADQSIYVHRSMIGKLRVGDEVQFELFMNSVRKPQARQVQVIVPIESARKYLDTVQDVHPESAAYIACPKHFDRAILVRPVMMDQLLVGDEVQFGCFRNSLNQMQAWQVQIVEPESGDHTHIGLVGFIEHVEPGGRAFIAVFSGSIHAHRAVESIYVHPSTRTAQSMGKLRVGDEVQFGWFRNSKRQKQARQVERIAPARGGLISGFVEHVEPGGGAFVACPGQFDRAVYVHHSMMGQLRVGDTVRLNWFRNSHNQRQASHVQVVKPPSCLRKCYGRLARKEGKEFGFIACPELMRRFDGSLVYVHPATMGKLCDGDEVQFEWFINSKGVPQVRHVQHSPLEVGAISHL